jgi:hypothetical protein
MPTGPRDILSAAARYVRDNPEVLVKAAIDAATLRFGIPVAALRWAASQGKGGKKAPKDVQIDTSPPALRLAATVDAMGTPVRASAAIRIDEVTIAANSVRIGVRLNDVKLALMGESDAPIATLIKSGALDLSKPGNLIKFIPKRPPMIVEAEGDRVVVDLLLVPQLAGNGTFRRVLSIVAPILGIRAIETDRDNLYVALRATPSGIREAIVAFRDGR